MAITTTCSNGHVLKVKDEFAGKSGLCPHCQGRVFVPMPVHDAEKARISDDEIAGLLGRPRQVKPKPKPPPEHGSVLDSAPDAAKEEPDNLLYGSSMKRKHKVCPECAHVTSISFANCPRCGTPIPDLPQVKK